MNISVDGAFVYFTIPILGGIPITQTAVSSWIVTILLITACIKLGKNLQKRPTGVQVLVEKGVGLIYDLTISAMGAHNADWAPLMGTIFLCSACGSLIGLTGFLRSATADLSCTLVWALMVSVIIWYNNIKHNGVVGWLKGFAQPISMAFRHFGNIAGGGVINSIIYTAFSMLSSLVLGLIASQGWLVGAILMAAGAALWIVKKDKLVFKIFGAVSFVLGLFGILQAMGILSGIPILSFGIPAVLSCYFDIFSGFVQALVFTLLSMVYISGSLPGPSDEVEA